MIFALELTHDINALPALLIASIVAHGFTVLVMKRSILTEKVARRGYHISREYAIDPLERLSVGEVMTADVVTIPASLPVRELVRGYFFARGPEAPGISGRRQGWAIRRRHHPVEPAGRLARGPAGAPGGVDPLGTSPIIAYDLIDRPPVGHPDESCREAAERMASAGVNGSPSSRPTTPASSSGSS